MNDQTAATAPSVKWGETVVNLADLPDASVHVLIQRTLNHIYGNEAAAVEKRMKDKGEHTADEIGAAVAAWREEKLDAILAGQLGMRGAGAPKATAFESLLRSIAVERLVAKLAKAKLKLPTAERKTKDKATGVETVKPAGVIVLKTKDGPKEFTREALIANELAKYGDEIKAEATRRQEESSLAAEGESIEDII